MTNIRLNNNTPTKINSKNNITEVIRDEYLTKKVFRQISQIITIIFLNILDKMDFFLKKLIPVFFGKKLFCGE